MKPRIPIPRSRRRRRLVLLVAALLLAAAVVIPAALVVAQDPPTDEVVFVNASEDPVERKGDGRFIARPVFSKRVAPLYYGVRDPDTGEFLTTMFRVQGGEKERKDGWEYSFEYPFEDGQVQLDKERAYLLVILAIKKRRDLPVLRRHPREPPRRHLEQDPERARPQGVGTGDRGLGDRGDARDALRGGRAGHGRRRRPLR